MENFIVSARKYRPVTFESVVGQQHITNTLKNAIKSNQLAQAFLFCGPRGVGKTTCARILAKTINCQNISPNIEPCGVCDSCRSFQNGNSFNIHELDAASNNSMYIQPRLSLKQRQESTMPAYFAERALLPQGWASHVRLEVDTDGLLTRIETNASAEDAQRLGGPVLPGMPNLHSHAFQRAMAGLAEVAGNPNDSFWTWRELMYRLTTW